MQQKAKKFTKIHKKTDANVNAVLTIKGKD